MRARRDLEAARPWRLALPLALALCALWPLVPARADDPRPAPRVEVEDPLGPLERVFVPVDQMDLLLASHSEGIVLDHAAYLRLLEAARAHALAGEVPAPVDGTFVDASGVIDLTKPEDVRVRGTWQAVSLQSGTSRVPFPLGGLALESLELGPEARHEQVRRSSQLVFDAPGRHRVEVVASARLRAEGATSVLDIHLPPAAAMAFDLVLPSGVEGTVLGAAGLQSFATPAEGSAPASSRTVRTRPQGDGHLVVRFARATKVADGPPILDAHVTTLHRLGDGRDELRAIVDVEIYRTATDTILLALPTDLSVVALGGEGVVRTRRSDDRTRLEITLDTARTGRVALTLQAETPFAIGAPRALPAVHVVDAVRERSTLGLSLGEDVRLHDVEVTDGRRLAAVQGEATLRYGLVSAAGTVRVDLAASLTRLEATSTHYLNLTETGKSLIVTTTYQVVEGTVHRLRPRVPRGFELRTLTIDGRTDGFVRDVRPDGTLDITLGAGVPAGRPIQLAAVLEQDQADWLPDGTAVQLPFEVPAAGADREEGLLGIGADAAFEVRERSRRDLVAVGAADLTARGVRAEGLVFGYRLDGANPSVNYEVERRVPVVEAEIVTTLVPGPRRLDVTAVVIHDVRRAGIRQLLVDVPSWAGAEVRFDGHQVRSHAKVERTADMPGGALAEGYERHAVVLGERIVGRHSLVVRYHKDLTEEAWTLPGEEALLASVPLERVERYIAVQRAAGLEVRLEPGAVEADARTIEVSDLPEEAPADPLATLEVLHLLARRDGLALGVRKHDGAAVLDAIATHVLLETAVAREGVLRTRATVVLRNAGRQQVAVRLPAGSHLLGALAGAAGGRLDPVKPLRSRAGDILVPLPGLGAGGQGAIALTYETRLAGPLAGDVDIVAPVFPGLEVIRTVQRVALDADLRVLSIDGDFGHDERRPPAPRVWFARWFARADGADAPTLSGAARPAGKAQDRRDAERTSEMGDPFVRNFSPLMSPVDLNGMIQAEAVFPDDWDADLAKREARAATTVTGAAYEAERMDLVPSNFTPPEPPVPDSRLRRDGGRRRPGAEADFEDRVANDPGDPMGAPSSDGPATRPPALAADARALEPPAGGGLPGGLPGSGPDVPPSGPGEGGFRRPEEPGRTGPRGPRRKGLLSLDIPVVLGPSLLQASRMGQGGHLRLRFEERDAPERRERLGFGLTLVLGALAAWGSRRRRWTTIAALFLAALLVRLVLGTDGAWLAVVVFDAASLITAFALGAALLRRVAHLPVRATAGALVALVLLGVTTSAPAHADDDEVPEPRRVFVPYDPAAPGLPDQPDRVFLPLSTWRHLFRLAHPGEDPELLRTGQVVAAEDVHWDVSVGPDEVEGRVVIDLRKDGAAQALVHLPLGGLAVTEALLDGQPIHLILDRGTYRVALRSEGAHRIEVAFRLPLVKTPDGERRFGFRTVPFPRATLRVHSGAFEGETQVGGLGRVARLADDARGRVDLAWLGSTEVISVRLVPPRAETLPEDVRASAQTRTVHSLRDGGTETDVDVQVDVLEGEAPFLDLALPAQARVLEARGDGVVRWEVADAPSGGRRVRLVFDKPRRGRIAVTVRIVRPAASDEREEILEDLPVLGVTSERGQVVVNAPPHRRAEILVDEGLFRIERPQDPRACGLDNEGVVVRAWRFSQRPTHLTVRLRAAERRLTLDETTRVLFGDDAVRTWIEAAVDVTGAPVGDFVFGLPGSDEVREVGGPHVAGWWLAGTGADRRLHVRLDDVRLGNVQLGLRLEQRLGGRLDGIAVPRLILAHAHQDRGRLWLYARPDVDPVAGGLPGLRATLAGDAERGATPHAGARVTHTFVRERALPSSLPVVLRRPEPATEAVVVSLVVPGDREHRLEQLVLFEVLRGAVDHVQVFVPDGGASSTEDVRARDLREVRRQPVTRAGADGEEVRGTLYDVSFQSPRTGLVALTLSGEWRADRPVRAARPEGAGAVRWFTLVRTWLDGQVTAGLLAGRADEASWQELPFVPGGLGPHAVVKAWVGRAPYALDVTTTRHRLGAQAEAVVLAAEAHIVVGLDGEARSRITYRVFNRSRQFLRVRLPVGGQLFGASSAGVPVKPLAGADGTLLLPMPKVPLGGRGYPVTLLYRVPVGGALVDGGKGTVPLPTLDDVEIERTVVRLHLPPELDVDVETRMDRAAAAAVDAELAEAATREARQLIEVAQTGTITQRQHALANGRVLLQEARQRHYKAARTKARALDEEIARLSREWTTRNEALQRDTLAAQGAEQTVTAQEDFGGNAASIVDFARSSEALVDAEALGEGGQAFWCFNGLDVAPPPKPGQPGTTPTTPLADTGLAQLKERLRQSLEVEKMEKSVDALVSTRDSKQAEQVAGLPELGNKAQLGWLNDNLELAQQRGAQLGAARGANLRGNVYRVQNMGGDTQGDGVQVFEMQQAQSESGPYQGGPGVAGGGDGGASSYLLQAGDGDNANGFYPGAGSGGGATGRWDDEPALQHFGSPLFGAEAEDSVITGLSGGRIGGGGGGGGAFRGRARTGVMGVDVALPSDGQVLHFVGLKAGAPIAFEASRPGWSLGARIALLAVLLGGLVLLGVAWVRRVPAMVA